MKDSAANSLILARPERLLRGLRPLVLRCAPDRRRALRGSYGAPGEIRTPGLLVRSQALYPAELRARKGRE
jgi:hypothetical protein